MITKLPHHLTNLSENGRVLIPAEIRKSLNLKAGDRLVMTVIDGEIRLVPQLEVIKRAQNIIAKYVDPRRSLSDELMQERRKEAKREVEE
ncbi:AbrB/MazE/SpoVT family DNA-binding domain-containing protein [Pleurocapsa sp. FMAR1]|uniref:AbrB/MazE/SpoVT family DNA-binding domain-containing protein n=1 Tax=Pleurocapsa sp. FMAR1 TaxID=3040204 RepID=UPI0029C6E963|nr:AbrB/MazE/SpoVT family DNA-binding domain-containing protein [Pleurocapsa sp. FMAR1]